jgi:phage terminase large subunit-like protein
MEKTIWQGSAIEPSVIVSDTTDPKNDKERRCTSFTAVYFVNNVMIPLTSRHASQRGDEARRKVY